MKTQTCPVSFKGFSIGGDGFMVIAGPCSIESEKQLLSSAIKAKSSGSSFLRGGTFKLRTSPKSFQGLGIEALRIAQKVKDQTGMLFVSEIIDPRHIDQMMDIVDVFQVGARNMHNYSLLKELGKIDKPIILKRNFSGLIEEWIEAASYISQEGNDKIIFCERGIRTFEKVTRNTFDLSAIAYIKQHTHFPIIADPSHATGRSDLIIPMSLAAIAAGADGLMVEIHPNPHEAKSDGEQALNFDQFEVLMFEIRKILKCFNKKLLCKSVKDYSEKKVEQEVQI